MATSRKPSARKSTKSTKAPAVDLDAIRDINRETGRILREARNAERAEKLKALYARTLGDKDVVEAVKIGGSAGATAAAAFSITELLFDWF